MDIEPIRLDTNLLNSAMQVKMHQQGQEELQRRHAILETGSAQKLELDAAEQTIKDPDASPFQKYQAANKRYRIMAPGSGDLPPIDYSDNAPDWNNFVLNLNTKGSQSPEVMQSLQRLSQNSSYFRQRAEDAMKQQQQVEINRGMASLPTRAGQPALSQDESLAAQHSGPVQKAIGESAFSSPKETAVVKEMQQRKAYLLTQEASLLKAHQTLDTAVTPIFHAEAEERLQQALSTRKVTGALGYDQTANDAGAVTTEERNAAKQALPAQRQQLNQQERQLLTELNKAKYDVSGQARPVEHIKAELDAVRQANFIKGKELAYAQHGSIANLQAMKQAYAQHDQALSTYTQQIKSVRDAQLHVAQSSSDSKLMQEHDLAAAQTHYLEHKNLLETAKLFPNVPPDKIRDVDKPLDRPLVDIKMGESLGKEIGPMMTESRSSALGAIETLDAVGRARTAIDKGMVTLGPTATIRNKIGQVSQMLGVGGADNEERLVNTRNVMRSLAQFSLGARKQLKGQGQVSDFEGKLIVKAESGEIDDMTMPEIKTFLSVTDRLAQRQYEQHQHNLKTMKGNSKLKELAPFYEVPEIKKSVEAEQSGSSPSFPTATGPGGKKLIYKEGQWQPLN